MFKAKSWGLGPTPEFISLISVKETNQRNRSLAGGFSIAGCSLFDERYDLGDRLEPIAFRLRGCCGQLSFKVAR